MKRKLWKWAVMVLAAIVLFVGGLCAGRWEQPPATLGLPAADMAVYADAEMGGGANTALRSAAADALVESGRKLVRTADMTLRTLAYDASRAQVEKSLAAVGGYEESLHESGDAGLRRLNLTLRVPSEKLDDFLTMLEGAGRVTSRSESTTDMTTQYQDNQARLNTLYQKRDRLNELLVQAALVSDLIEIEAAIADAQYEIDRYETRQRTIDKQVDMSQVTLTLVEDGPADTAQASVPLGQRITAGFAASVEWCWQFLQDAVVLAAMLLPAALPVAASAAVIIIKKRKRKDP